MERLGKSILSALNLAKPSSQDILKMKDHIQNHSFIWTDGLSSYNELIEEKQCDHKIVKTKDDYDRVNHLNNVNSFHQKIEAQYKRYKALFTMQRECRDMDSMETLIYIKRKLKKTKCYFYIRQLTTLDIFTCIPERFA